MIQHTDAKHRPILTILIVLVALLVGMVITLLVQKTAETRSNVTPTSAVTQSSTPDVVDTTQFLIAARSIFYSENADFSDERLIKLGKDICNLHQNYMSDEDIAMTAANGVFSTLPNSVDDSVRFVAASEEYLCK